MNILYNIYITIFSSPVYSAILFMVIFTALASYIGLTAKVIDDKPRKHKAK